MENNVNFFIEVKDDSGKWHLVKWMSDYCHFTHEGDIYTNPEKTVAYTESDITATGKIAEYIYNRNINVGNGLTEELTISNANEPLPTDISDELKSLVDYYGYKINDFLSVIYLNELQFKSASKIVEWKNEILKKASEKAENENYYPDTLEYLLNEGYYEAFSIEYEIQALREYAKAYSNNRFIKDENIRLYYYFE